MSGRADIAESKDYLLLAITMLGPEKREENTK